MRQHNTAEHVCYQPGHKSTAYGTELTGHVRVSSATITHKTTLVFH